MAPLLHRGSRSSNSCVGAILPARAAVLQAEIADTVPIEIWKCSFGYFAEEESVLSGLNLKAPLLEAIGLLVLARRCEHPGRSGINNELTPICLYSVVGIQPSAPLSLLLQTPADAFTVLVCSSRVLVRADTRGGSATAPLPIAEVPQGTLAAFTGETTVGKNTLLQIFGQVRRGAPVLLRVSLERFKVDSGVSVAFRVF